MTTITVMMKIRDVAIVLTNNYRSKGTDLEPITSYFDHHNYSKESLRAKSDIMAHYAQKIGKFNS